MAGSRVVTSRDELIARAKQAPPIAAFVSADMLPHLQGLPIDVAVIAIVDDSFSSGLRSLDAYPWLAHLVHSSMLDAPFASQLLRAVLERIANGADQPILRSADVWRVALLASSERRDARFERMQQFFAMHGIPSRTVTTLTEIAEELVMNALYDAPFESGYFEGAVPRTEEVELPPEHACEISYGVEDDSALIRVRDPFGALTRERLLEVLTRCDAGADVPLDPSRGGAGLGLWRVFSKASVVEISVIPGRVTDILVRIDPKGRRAKQRAFALHLFIEEHAARDGVHGRFAADHDSDLLDMSFTAVISPSMDSTPTGML